MREKKWHLHAVCEKLWLVFNILLQRAEIKIPVENIFTKAAKKQKIGENILLKAR